MPSARCLTIARPRPGAPELAAARLVHAVEALEDPRQVLGRDAGAVVRAPRAGPRPPAAGPLATSTRPPSGVYLTAFSTRFSRIRRSRSASVTTAGAASSHAHEGDLLALGQAREGGHHVLDDLREERPPPSAAAARPTRGATARAGPRRARPSGRRGCGSCRGSARAVSGSSTAPSSRASTNPRIEVRGVRSSWEALATKSRRIRSRRRRSVTSWKVSDRAVGRRLGSPGKGTAVSAKTRRRWRISTSTGAPLAGAQHLLDHARPPRAAGSPPGSGGRAASSEVEAAAQARRWPGSPMPRWSTASTPSSIAERMASMRARSRAISARRPCSWSAE